MFDPNRYWSSHSYKVEELHMSITCPFPINGHNKSATQLYIKGGKTWNKEWIIGGPTEWGGVGLNKDIVNINENYINYIKSNPKLVQPMYDLAVADTGTTGHYLTIDSPCKNKNRLYIFSPSKFQTGKSSHQRTQHSCLTQTCRFKYDKHIFLQVSIRPCCTLGHCAIMDVKPPSMASLYAFLTNGVERSSW